jgi:hypothetical protein
MIDLVLWEAPFRGGEKCPIILRTFDAFVGQENKKAVGAIVLDRGGEVEKLLPRDDPKVRGRLRY